MIKCEGIRGIESLEEVLLFKGRTEEGVEKFTKLLEVMWAERGRLIESREGNALRSGAVI